MGLNEQQLDDARAIVCGTQDLRADASALRSRHPGLRAMVLDALDMRGEEPALRMGPRALYFVATDGHCWSVTEDPARASGVILTQE